MGRLESLEYSQKPNAESCMAPYLKDYFDLLFILASRTDN